MKIIPNEKKYAEHILATKYLSSKPSTEISVLIKYFYYLGLSPEEVMGKMMEFMEEATGNSKAWKMKLKRDIKSKQDSKLNVVEQIHITQTELDAIGMLKNEALERLAFGLLVLLKIENEAKGRSGDWIVLKNSSDLFKDIKVNRNSVQRELMIGTLEELGYVFNSVRSGKCAMKINYVDFEGEPAITITSFDDFIVERIDVPIVVTSCLNDIVRETGQFRQCNLVLAHGAQNGSSAGSSQVYSKKVHVFHILLYSCFQDKVIQRYKSCNKCRELFQIIIFF